MAQGFRKFWLLIWKNMLLRRRHWVVTTFEVLLPTLCAAILAYANSKIDTFMEGKKEIAGIEVKSGPTITVIREKNYGPIPELSMFEVLKKEFICASSNGCAYSPANTYTKAIMFQVQKYLTPTLGSSKRRFRFIPLENEDELDQNLVNNSLSTNDVFDAAIIFEEGYPLTGDRSSETSVSYKIRLRYTFVDSLLNFMKNEIIMPVDDTERLFPDKILDPNDPSQGETQKLNYYLSGFLGLQWAIDKAIIKILTGQEVEESVSIQPFPIPSYAFREQDKSASYMLHTMVLPTFLILGFIFIVPSIMLGVVSEKETGIRELLKMNGVPGWLQWLSWLVNSLMILVLSVTIVAVLLFLNTVQYGDPGVWYLFILLYMISAISSCFFVSSFFTRPILATIVGIILWLTSYFPVFAYFELVSNGVTFSEKMWACLLPNVAFYLAVKIMMTYERDGVGAQWSNFLTSVTPGRQFSLGYLALMFVVNTICYLTLTVYLENVISTEFSVRRPWYYIFQPTTWGLPSFSFRSLLDRRKKAGKKSTSSPDEAQEETLPPQFEAPPNDLPVGIQIQNLRKEYPGQKVAVDGINLKMFTGEIFVLLGHNGAGKTTTISMLSGTCAPTAGTAQVNGYDVRQQLEKARENLGLCPQQNMLFDFITVSEHMTFFGKLRGLSGPNSRKHVQDLIYKLELWDSRNTLSKFLSGGQKRKLHLGIALLGQGGVAILDEPTSGMDPEARRAIWDVLLEMRAGRTMLLTTHFMEEADVLGDRIAIMASGKVQCSGTSSFLKNFYGAGYTLKLGLVSAGESENVSRNPSMASSLGQINASSNMLPLENYKIPEILEWVQKYVPDAFLKNTNRTNAREVFITLPTAEATTGALASLFSALPQERLEISTVALGRTTLDEVFLRVGEIADGTVNEEASQIDNSLQVRCSRPPKGCNLWLIQFWALLNKKILYTYRKRKLVICQIIVPVLLLIGAILSCNGFFAPLGHPHSTEISFKNYKDPVLILSTGNVEEKNIVSSLLDSSISTLDVQVSKVTQKLLEVAHKSLNLYNNHYIAGIEVSGNNFIAHYSTNPNHAAPIAVNLVSNTLLRKMSNGKRYRIHVTNHPMRTDAKLVIGSTKPEISDIFYATVLFEVFLPIGLAMLAATFTVLPMEEKLTKAKQLQMLTGVHPLIFWGSSFVWDFVVVMVVVFMMLICFPVFQSHVMYTSYGGAGVACLILLVYGYCAIIFSYFMSHFAKTVQGAFALVTIIHIVSGLVVGIVVSALDILVVFEQESLTRHALQWTGRIFPTYGAVISTTRYVETAIDNGRCNVLTPKNKMIICAKRDGKSSGAWEYLQCCDWCAPELEKYTSGSATVPPSSSSYYTRSSPIQSSSVQCFTPQPYIRWSNPRESMVQGVMIDVPGIAQELTIMVIMSFAYLSGLMAMEYRHWIKIKLEQLIRAIPRSRRIRQSPYGTSIESQTDKDEDVLEEERRTEEMVTEGRLVEDALIVYALQKLFGDYVAVRRISFGVHYGEVFGLLGVNGAGKTTTFRMLTGDETPTAGKLYALSQSLERNRRKYLMSFGYCPQFDGIIGVLKGKEMLELFCWLRGISGQEASREADRWLKNLGLEKSGKVECRNYSGGMKRRLCCGIAMIGDPPIILLDEPTSGVDPVSRRQFWKVIQSVRNSGQAIILTSHSMEECESLCSRLGIMVNGELQCLGGVQHLKGKFAQGFTLALKLKQKISVELDEFQSLHEKITEVFQPCSVKDKHNNFIQYEIHNVNLSWEYLFKNMEELKGSFQTFIEDYSINETSLEEVFLSFARRQYGDRRKPKKCSCSCL